LAVEFKQIDDFHPDHLYRSLGLFQALRETRARLHDPETFARAVADLKVGDFEPPESGDFSTPARQDQRAGSEDDNTMLERLLGRKPGGSPPAQVPAPTQRIDIGALIKSIVSPYVVPEASPFQAQYLASVDAATSDQMRAMLHHPAFQALESLWRSVHWLITNLEVGEQLELHLLDVTKGELLADIEAAQGNLELSGLYRLLVEKGRGALGGDPWSLLVGSYTFGISGEDPLLLGSLGAIASQTRGPFLAAADASLLGCRSLVATPDPRDWGLSDSAAAQRWEALRVSSLASWIGLALPRVLLRLPYGKDTDRVEQFEFEELTPARDHESYLWGNPAVACALLIGRSFLTRGWAMEPGDDLDIGDLPAHTFEKDGEPQLQACAEVYLTERAGEAILSRGLMPWFSHKNRNAIRLMRFQSLADPPRPLSGPWCRDRGIDGVPA
jgi:type VI secretion system protein ImpC